MLYIVAVLEIRDGLSSKSTELLEFRVVSRYVFVFFMCSGWEINIKSALVLEEKLKHSEIISTLTDAALWNVYHYYCRMPFQFHREENVMDSPILTEATGEGFTSEKGFYIRIRKPVDHGHVNFTYGVFKETSKSGNNVYCGVKNDITKLIFVRFCKRV